VASSDMPYVFTGKMIGLIHGLAQIFLMCLRFKRMPV